MNYLDTAYAFRLFQEEGNSELYVDKTMFINSDAIFYKDFMTKKDKRSYLLFLRNLLKDRLQCQ